MVRSYVTAPTIIMAIIARPAKMPSPIGSTDIDLPGRPVLITPTGDTVVVDDVPATLESVFVSVALAPEAELVVFERLVLRFVAPLMVGVPDVLVVEVGVDTLEDGEVEPPVETAVVILMDATSLRPGVVVKVGSFVVVLVPPSPPPVSGVWMQVYTTITSSSPFTVVGVNLTVHTWRTGLPFESVVWKVV